MKKLLILLAALGGILLFSGCESKGWKTVDGAGPYVVLHCCNTH